MNEKLQNELLWGFAACGGIALFFLSRELAFRIPLLLPIILVTLLIIVQYKYYNCNFQEYDGGKLWCYGIMVAAIYNFFYYPDIQLAFGLEFIDGISIGNPDYLTDREPPINILWPDEQTKSIFFWIGLTYYLFLGVAFFYGVGKLKFLNRKV